MTARLNRRDLLLAGTIMAFIGKPASAHNGVVHVVIEGLSFEPGAVEAKVGERIEWANHDPFSHTATVAGGWEVLIPPGQKATHVVTESDNVDYFCRFHPNMKGRIKVIG